VTEAKRDYFLIRLWDADELLGALFDVYDELPGDVKSALPLKRVWALVPDD
jgi:restriction system protein